MFLSIFSPSPYTQAFFICTIIHSLFYTETKLDFAQIDFLMQNHFSWESPIYGKLGHFEDLYLVEIFIVNLDVPIELDTIFRTPYYASFSLSAQLLWNHRIASSKIVFPCLTEKYIFPSFRQLPKKKWPAWRRSQQWAQFSRVWTMARRPSRRRRRTDGLIITIENSDTLSMASGISQRDAIIIRPR